MPADSHQIGRVVLEVDRAVRVDDRAAGGILRLRAARREQDIGCVIGNMLAAALVRLLRDEDRRGLARLVGQNAELAGV